MKILNFLKSKAGKFVIGAPQMLTIAGVGLVATYGAFKTDQIIDNDTPLRTLSSVSAASSYEGLNRRADGMLSSMNIQNREGRKGVAVGADRARLEGNRSANDFGLTAVDNLGRTITVPGTGAAAASSVTDGLGSGGVDMVEVGGGNSSGRASVPGVNASSVAQGANGASAAGTPGGRLASASMARASGNAFNAASGAMVGGSSGATGSRSGAASHAPSEGYQFSGAMPSGSNVVSAQAGLNGARGGSSQFLAGGRNASVGRGGRRVNEKDDLKQISKMSADVAKDRNRGAVAGARPFLANSATTAGMSIDAGTDATTAGSADFSTPTDRKLKAIGDWGEQVKDDSADRSKARTRLLWMTLALLAATIAALPAIFYLIALGSRTGLFGAAFKVWGWILAGVIMAYAATVIGFAIDYFANYSGNKFLPSLSCLMGAGAITMVLVTALKASSLNPSGNETEQKEAVKNANFFKHVLGFGKSAGKTAATTVGTSAVNKMMSDN